ncbi:hypothetical protein M426DRAFT_9524 [Hypoxylon sp. CI-4A]|nr:hypothetical protein M426DRAFT_9524 [Hypoxylon sp. CI-4A]
MSVLSTGPRPEWILRTLPYLSVKLGELEGHIIALKGHIKHFREEMFNLLDHHGALKEWDYWGELLDDIDETHQGHVERRSICAGIIETGSLDMLLDLPHAISWLEFKIFNHLWIRMAVDNIFRELFECEEHWDSKEVIELVGHLRKLIKTWGEH